VAQAAWLGQLAASLLTGEPAGWAIKKGALWWFSNRGAETVLHAVVAPDLL
jgi:phosphohistidine phosphatase